MAGLGNAFGLGIFATGILLGGGVALADPPPKPAERDATERVLQNVYLAMVSYGDSSRNHEFFPPSEKSWRVSFPRAYQLFSSDELKDDQGKTRFLLVTGPGTFFDPANERTGGRNYMFTTPRQKSTYILLVQVGADKAVGVDEKRDFVFDPKNPKAGLGEVGESFVALMGSGQVRRIPSSISPELFTYLCRLEPLPDDATFEKIKPELKQLGISEEQPKSRFGSP